MKLQGSPDSQSRPENRHGTKSYREYMAFCAGNEHDRIARRMIHASPRRLVRATKLAFQDFEDWPFKRIHPTRKGSKLYRFSMRILGSEFRDMAPGG